MSPKNNNLLDFLQFQPQDSANVNIVAWKDVKAVYFLMIQKKPCMILLLIKGRKFKWNFIGEKKTKKLKKYLIISKILVWLIKKIKIQKKRQELQFKIVSNFSKNLKFWEKKMLGIVQNVKILFWPKNKCKFIRPLKS